MSIPANESISNAQTSLRNKATDPSQKANELGKNDFMNLFLTQMSNQTPTDPMDSGAMMTQISQLGSMEQLENLNAEMIALNATQKDIARFQALGFLERDVLMETDGLELFQGSGKPVYYSVDRDAESIRVAVEDWEGLPIYTQQFGLTPAGKHRFVWDGKNDEGVAMDDGKYQLNFHAEYTDGSSAKLRTYDTGKVTQVEYKNGEPWVKTNRGLIPLSKIRAIDNSSERLFGNLTPLAPVPTLPPKEMIKKN